MNGKTMYFKLISVFAILIVLFFTFQNTAYSKDTVWEKTNTSLSELLNSGWQITAHSSNRVAASSNAGASFDEETFTFLLTKNKKYVMCAVKSNRAPCLKLN
jgi:hypothetical protein